MGYMWICKEHYDLYVLFCVCVCPQIGDLPESHGNVYRENDPRVAGYLKPADFCGNTMVQMLFDIWWKYNQQ